MTRKIQIMAICFIALAFFFTGATVSPTPALALKVAIVLPGTITDESFCQSGYEGLKLIEKELGAEIAYSERVSEADQVENIRDYARRGYDLVIAHGGQMDDAAKKVAAKFPKVKFFVTNGQATGPNIGNGGLNPTHFGYLVGLVGGKMTKSNKLAYITGNAFPLNDAVAGAFKAGVKDVNPKADVSVIFTGSWDDVAKAKEAAFAQISRGVDVLIPALNLATLGVIEGAREKGVYAIGFSRDQLHVAPDTVLCSAIQNYGAVLFHIARLVKEGKFEGKSYMLGVETSGVTGIGKTNKVVSKDVIAIVEKAKQDLATGKITPYPWP
ncbi:BMP family protein [bacterium]|nr:BMP family protein [bacterium]